MCEGLEVVVSKFGASPDRRFAGYMEAHLGMTIMEMCECECAEILDPMTYKQFTAFVSVPALLRANPSGGGAAGALLRQLATVPGPPCPLPHCSKQMAIHRYLMPPFPRVLAVSLTYDGMGGGGFDGALLAGVFAHLDAEIELQQAYKGIATSMPAVLVGMLGCSPVVHAHGAGRYVGFFNEGGREWCCFDDTVRAPHPSPHGTPASDAACAHASPTAGPIHAAALTPTRRVALRAVDERRRRRLGGGRGALRLVSDPAIGAPLPAARTARPARLRPRAACAAPVGVKPLHLGGHQGESAASLLTAVPSTATTPQPYLHDRLLLHYRFHGGT